MSGRVFRVLATVVVSLTGLAGQAAAGVDGGTADGPPQDVVGGTDAGADGAASPPEVVSPVTPEFPPPALAEGLEASVVVKVDVDTEGRATDAVVVRPVGHGFDEAARAAALRTRFRPAQRFGRVIPSRISLRIDFRLPPTPVAPPSLAPVPRPRPPSLPPFDVTVRGESAVDRRRHSAETVTIVETERAKRETADLGEVLSRTQGVSVRQEGGLGSPTRFSINGLIDDQVRFFLDGVPLELAGYPFGIANVPVNLIDAVEIYGGVVPVRFAADALGGAVNVVTNQDVHGTHATASYKIGSFETHRLTLSGRHLHEPSGFFVRAAGFADYALNDYRVDVDVPDAEGQLSPARVHLSHARYRAAGGNLELGFVDRPWAKRLLARAFVTNFERQYQSNNVMTVPFGGITYGETSVGGSLRYEQTFGAKVTLEAVAAYAFTRGRFQDLATCVYDWFGQCVRERRQPGEFDGRPHDQTFKDQADFARAYVTWRPVAWQALRLALAPPRFALRSGDERRQLDPAAPDRLNAERRLITMINGLEHQADLVQGRLENIAFAKQYLQLLDADDVKPTTIRHVERSTLRFGLGDGLRYRLAEGLWLKASYEWATRLPRPDEIFGDNAFILANLELQPERSHNANLGVMVDRRGSRAGALRGTVNGFARLTEQLIVLLGDQLTSTYRNVYDARSVGVEGAAGWSSPRDLIVLEGSFTWQDLRNVSSKGTFGAFDGDRIPNRPYLFGYGLARLQLRDVMAPLDEISFTWSTRYVHEYFRNWESIGQTQYKQVIPAQTVHTVGAAYLVRKGRSLLSVALEVQNLTDERVFDYFGVQRPGRAFYAKTTAEF